MSGRVDWAAVRPGALAAGLWCLPVAILADAVVDEDEPGALGTLLYVAVLLGFALGGFVAAQRTTDSPISSGAVAALLAFAAIALVTVATNAVQGDGVAAGGLVFNGLLAYGAGLLGASAAARRRAA